MGWNKTSQIKITSSEANNAEDGKYDDAGTSVTLSIYLHYGEFKKLNALLILHGTRTISMELANMIKRSYAAIASSHGLNPGIAPTVAQLKALERGETIVPKEESE